MLVCVPLSLGAAFGVIVALAPALIVVAGYAPSVGSVLLVTLTINSAVAVPVFSSVTVKVMIFAPSTALQPAATVAVMRPLVLTTLVTVRPVADVVAVTNNLPSAVSMSLTVARFATVPALPCCRVKAAAALITGGRLSGVHLPITLALKSNRASI